MDKHYYINQNIKNTERVFPVQGRDKYLRLDMNESIKGLPESFVSEVISEITPEFLSTYPEPGRFIGAYSKYAGIPRESITVTNGTDSAIRYILHTFGEPGKNVVTVTPTFEMYRINCSILGLNHVPVSYEPDFSIDVEKIISAITDDTRIVVLINPNNPMGNTYSEVEAKRIFDAAKARGAIVLVDEAYHYFTEESLLTLAREYDNVLVLRTFSKLMSLAALRLGVVMGDPALIKYINNGRLTFEVNSVALLFGERLLGRRDIIDEMVERERAGKEYLISWLSENDYDYIPCKGNFVLVRTKSDSHKLAKWLEEEKHILVHAYGNPLLSSYVRISTADTDSMKCVCKAFLEYEK